MERSAMLEALHQGIQVEIQGLTFYRRAIERTEDVRGKEVWRSLVHEEQMHLHLLKVQYGALVGEGRWLSMERARELAPGRDVEELFPADDNALVDLLPAGADDLAALGVALEFERGGYQMYRRLAQETSDPAGRALYQFLGDQEQKHFDLIHRAQEYLQTQGAWYYDEQELPMFEG